LLGLLGCSGTVTSDGSARGTSTSGSGGAATCEPYEDHLDGATAVTIRVTNGTASDVFIGEGASWTSCSADPELATAKAGCL
jgi:hypothetical protein